MYKKFMNDEKGSVMIFMSIILFVGFSVAALAVDTSYFYVLKNRLQTTADIAVLASVEQIPNGEDAIRATALEYALKNMSVSDHGNILLTSDILTGNWDTDSRTFTPGDTPLNAVKVTTQRSQDNSNTAGTFFANIFGTDSVNVVTSSIGARLIYGESCVLALSTTASNSVSTSGTANVSISGCHVASNSVAADSISVGGTSTLEVDCISTVGDVTGSPTLNVCSEPNVGVRPIPDPYADIVMPTGVPCDYNGNYSLQDGSLVDGNGDGYIKVCGRLTIKGNFTLEDYKTYIITSTFSVNATAVTSATSVTFIVEDNVIINGGASFNISAPDYDQQFVGQAGMVFIQDPSTPNHVNNTVLLNGGSNTEFTGVIYVPNNDVTFTGGNTTGSDGCTQIVALTISFGGNADLDSDCDLAGVESIDLYSPSSLVN